MAGLTRHRQLRWGRRVSMTRAGAEDERTVNITIDRTDDPVQIVTVLPEQDFLALVRDLFAVTEVFPDLVDLEEGCVTST